MKRPVFQEEILGEINGSNEPQYEIKGSMENATLKLQNPITQEGTPFNAINLNNLFNFDNLPSMRGGTQITRFPTQQSIVETIEHDNIVNAIRATNVTSEQVISIETILSNCGTKIVRQTTSITTFDENGFPKTIVI